jgi:sensor c-di-GMP phosphodiesterase-like protein
MRGELQVWHQAKIALATGEVAGTEALLRWKHPQRGMVPPGTFIPQVEETTLINSVTQVVIATAFADAGSWRAAGHRLRVSINLSVRNLQDHMLFDVLEQHARRNELEPTDIDLEITRARSWWTRITVFTSSRCCVTAVIASRWTISAPGILRWPICRSCASRASKSIRRL